MREALSRSQDPAREVHALIRGSQGGWRPQIVGAVAALLSPTVHASWIDALWVAADGGSWVSPQLAVTAWRLDPQFNVRARERVLSRCPLRNDALLRMPWAERHSLHGPTSGTGHSAKVLSALLVLLEEAGEIRFVSEQRNLTDVAGILAQDSDDGASIARHWLGALQANRVW